MKLARRLLLVLCLGGGCAPLARADIYSFTDPAGATHYSNVPADPRYVLLFTEPKAAAGLTRGRRGAGDAYAGLIVQAARGAGLQPALLQAMVAVESGFNPQAVSRKGALGLMQLLPETAQRYGVQDAFDPGDNLRAGARYVHDLMRRYGNLELALAAYNAGEEAVERYGRAVPPYPETRAYVPSVLGLYHRLLATAHGDYQRALRDPT